ncbi:MAB_1171c family putative transporter [Streptomyces abikoensis]|uniref:MAB_1171c family putative transporter n=1 Tax=Streptomyces abikoensis TaxID=97398 RepID=UPI0033CD1B81
MGVFFFAALTVAIAWKLYQVRREPGDAPLRQVTWCLLAVALSYPLTSSTGLAMVADHGAAKIGQNLLLMVAVHFLMRFYLYSASDGQAARRRARWESLAAVIAIAVAGAVGATAPAGALVGSYATYDMTIPQVSTFYLVAGLYMCYALSASCWWTRRYARGSERPLSTGLWLAAAGLLGMAAACAVRAVFVVIRSQGHAVPHALTIGAALLLVLSMPLFVVGVSYPGVRARAAAVRLWMQHRRIHSQLEPLWHLLTETYPQTVLPSDPKNWRDRLLTRGVHRRLHRRLIEIRDGLVRISPHLGQHAADADLSSPEQLAQHLRTAAQAVRQGLPAPRNAIPLAKPQEDNRAADVQQLVAVSAALSTHCPNQPSERVTC